MGRKVGSPFYPWIFNKDGRFDLPAGSFEFLIYVE